MKIIIILMSLILSFSVLGEDKINQNYKIGYSFLFGTDTVKQDLKIAFKYMKLAAEEDSAEAQHLLGLMYYLNKGAKKNDKEAFKWFKKSLINGNNNSIFYLGKMYYLGEGTSINNNLAFKLFQISSKNGNKEADYYLGKMYENGLGVKKNIEKSLIFYENSSNKGYKKANEELIRLNNYIHTEHENIEVKENNNESVLKYDNKENQFLKKEKKILEEVEKNEVFEEKGIFLIILNSFQRFWIEDMNFNQKVYSAIGFLFFLFILFFGRNKNDGDGIISHIFISIFGGVIWIILIPLGFLYLVRWYILGLLSIFFGLFIWALIISLLISWWTFCFGTVIIGILMLIFCPHFLLLPLLFNSFANSFILLGLYIIIKKKHDQN